MALYRKTEGGTYYFSVYVPAASRRLRGSCGTTVLAEAELVEKMMRLAAGSSTPRERLLRMIDAILPPDEGADDVTLDALAFDYSRQARLAAKVVGKDTSVRTKHSLDKLVAWIRAKHPRAKTLRQIDRRCAQAYAQSLYDNGLTSKSVYNNISILSAAWRILARGHDDMPNPWLLAKPVEHQADIREPFTADEVRRLIEAGDKAGHGWGIACRIAAATGLRYGDVVRLRFEDIRDGAIYLRPSKTAKHAIEVCLPLPADLLELIGNGTGYIMPELGEAYVRTRYYKPYVFRRLMDAAGIEARGRTFHSFRHYFRTRLAAAGVSDDTAKRLGGWTQDSTARRYDHDEHRAELAAAINAAWTAPE